VRLEKVRCALDGRRGSRKRQKDPMLSLSRRELRNLGLNSLSFLSLLAYQSEDKDEIFENIDNQEARTAKAKKTLEAKRKLVARLEKSWEKRRLREELDEVALQDKVVSSIPPFIIFLFSLSQSTRSLTLVSLPCLFSPVRRSNRSNRSSKPRGTTRFRSHRRGHQDSTSGFG